MVCDIFFSGSARQANCLQMISNVYIAWLIFYLGCEIMPSLVTKGSFRCNRFYLSSHRIDQNQNPIAHGTDANTPITRRRKRYKGLHPRNFDEKYKEARGDPEIIRKVLDRGKTPAGRHVPIMLQDCMAFLGLHDNVASPDIVVMDCTIGYGGHAREILKFIVSNGGKFVGLDRDEVTLRQTEERLKNALSDLAATDKLSSKFEDYCKLIHSNFQGIEHVAKTLGIIGNVTAVLADLGLSSMQIDNPSRGFTYKSDGPLDMRMDTAQVMTAKDWLAATTVKDLTKRLEENSDESFAFPIASNILRKNEYLPNSTAELVVRIRQACRDECKRRGLSEMSKQEEDASVARTMQAIRIEVNDEFGSLERLLESLPRILKPGGRAVLLTFHSGEDRRVKKSFKSGAKAGIYSSWGRDVVRASAEERRNNPRSKCAKLRWAVRAGGSSNSTD